MKAKLVENSGTAISKPNLKDRLLTGARNQRTAPAMKLKTILVPIDFSNCARKALRYAASFAKGCQASLTLLYVVPHDVISERCDGKGYPPLERQMLATAERELTKMVKVELGGNVSVNCLIRVGTPALEIENLARTLPVDLIVISTHGRTGWKWVCLGSVTEHVVRYAPCPVLVVREFERDFIAS